MYYLGCVVWCQCVITSCNGTAIIFLSQCSCVFTIDTFVFPFHSHWLSFADIFVEFSPNTYTVTEGTDDYVNVTVRATGFPGPSFDVDSITILLTTESGSAEGKQQISLIITCIELALVKPVCLQLGLISRGSSGLSVSRPTGNGW